MPESVPTPADIMRQTAIGNGFHRWALEGGSVELDADDLWPLLQEAYDPNTADWPAKIAYDASSGWWVA